MKKKLIYLSILVLASFIAACDENEIMPSYTKKGTTTHTMAGLSASNEEPVPLENISVLLSYVNPSSDPLKTVTLKVKVGDAAFTEVQSWDISQETKDEIQTKVVAYQVPDSPGAVILFDMVITSQREYPQTKRVEIDVEG
jgi:hypothetical protein